MTNPKGARPSHKGRKRRLNFKRLFLFCILLGVLFITACSGAALCLFADSDATTEQKAAVASLGSRLGRIIFLRDAVENKLQRHDYTTIDQMPQYLKNAVVAVEDNRFYEHRGFDLTGIARASLVNLQKGEVAEGASTITQQLVKNLFLSPEQTLGRKAEELLLALDMEAHYDKEEILELYLNSIYFGSNFYGITAAARGYFGKEPKDLNLAEAALLAGLPNAPSLYSPYVDFLLAKKRQFVVLESMVAHGYLTKKTAEDAKIEPLELAKKNPPKGE
ncbi:MAG: transglycosylase domain-containing protein [Selenomonadaceae bacterium]|nr:transglycosylase domain-containing protein [Selenomonadaceae bacterium]